METMIKISFVAFLTVCLFGIPVNSQALEWFKRKAPKCGSEEVKKTVLELVKEHADNSSYEYKRKNIQLEFIRATSFDKEIGSYECAAKVKWKGGEMNITYTVSIGEDDDNSFVVEASMP